MNDELLTFEMVNCEIPLELNYGQTKRAGQILRALDHELRYKILVLLDEGDWVNVTHICRQLRIRQPIASLHLGLLRKAGIVRCVRDGKEIYYQPDYERIDKIAGIVSAMFK